MALPPQRMGDSGAAGNFAAELAALYLDTGRLNCGHRVDVPVLCICFVALAQVAVTAALAAKHIRGVKVCLRQTV